MTVLATRGSDWFLAGSSGNPQWEGYFSIKVGKMVVRCEGFYWQEEPTYLHATVEDNRRAEFRYFPEVRYQGHRAYPQWWHREEPGMLMCLVPINVGEGPTPPLTQEEWAELGLTPRDDGYAGYIHVDDLEKIEGPPPEGAF